MASNSPVNDISLMGLYPNAVSWDCSLSSSRCICSSSFTLALFLLHLASEISSSRERVSVFVSVLMFMANLTYLVLYCPILDASCFFCPPHRGKKRVFTAKMPYSTDNRHLSHSFHLFSTFMVRIRVILRQKELERWGLSLDEWKERPQSSQNGLERSQKKIASTFSMRW